MTIRTRLAVAVAALCVGAALPASAGAETKDPGAPFTIGFKVTYVDPIGRTAVGVVSCAAPVANGNKARFSIDPQVELYTLAVGDQVMVRVEDRRIVQVTPEQPCDSAPAGQPTDDQPAAGDDHGADPASDDAGDDTNGDETDARPARTGHGPRGEGAKLPHFMRAFANRVWRFTGEANGFDNGQLDVTVDKILNLPKRFASQDNDIVDQDAIALVGAGTRVYDADGHRVDAAQLDGANDVRVVGKLLAPRKWVDDEDGSPTTTIRAKRVFIVD